MKRRIPSSGTASALGTSAVLLVEGLPTLRDPNYDLLLFSLSSLQSSRNRTGSPIAVTPSLSIFSLLIDGTIEGTIISRRNTAASVEGFPSSRYHPFFRAQQSNKRMFFWEPGDDRNEPSSSDL